MMTEDAPGFASLLVKSIFEVNFPSSTIQTLIALTHGLQPGANPAVVMGELRCK